MLVGGLGAYVLGHLPWGALSFAEGAIGTAIGAILPRAGTGNPSDAGYTAFAVCGLLLVALALSPRAGSGE